MDAIFRISTNEFNEDLFKKLKSLIKSFGTGELTIAFNNNANEPSELKDAYWDQLRASISEIEQGKGIVFTMDELDTFIHNKGDE